LNISHMGCFLAMGLLRAAAIRSASPHALLELMGDVGFVKLCCIQRACSHIRCMSRQRGSETFSLRLAKQDGKSCGGA
jgi:hypothetical protein